MATDCRLSYERIGSIINLTRNSVKTRIKKMVSEGVIQEFITDINFAMMGYRICYIITKQSQGEEYRNPDNHINSRNDNNGRKIVIDKIVQIGDILAEIEILGGASIFRVAIREVNGDKENELIGHNVNSLLDLDLIEKVIPIKNSKSVESRTYMLKDPQNSYLTSTDLKILRCLVSNPQIRLVDISNIISVSEKTVNRTLNKLKYDGVIRFSVICDPKSMKGFVVFGLLLYLGQEDDRAGVEGQKKNMKSISTKILELLYSEFSNYSFLRSPIISHDNIILLSVYGNDVFAIDSMYKRVLSFENVTKAELYVFTAIKYYKEWMLRDIDYKLKLNFNPKFLS